MFRIGDKIVHPMHGAGVVDGIVQRKVNGVVRDYYTLKLPIGGMLVMIPTDHCDQIGVRAILSGDEAEHILDQLSDVQVEMQSNWNHRYRENMDKMRSGSIYDVADVVKCLRLRESEKGLSAGERKMLATAKLIISGELATVLGVDQASVEEKIC